jgi:hypothetical protein
MPLRRAAGLGTLMNTRPDGLRDLDIGLDIRVISPALLSLMVLALVTTFMATALLRWFCPDWILLEQSHSIPSQEPAIWTLASPSAN